ncbi:hypothetical protein evm_009144 [Chilo suppressalis]|nr:hypothetical protein evm_009144 [Chilo suppressalis]
MYACEKKNLKEQCIGTGMKKARNYEESINSKILQAYAQGFSMLLVVLGYKITYAGNFESFCLYYEDTT